MRGAGSCQCQQETYDSQMAKCELHSQTRQFMNVSSDVNEHTLSVTGVYSDGESERDLLVDKARSLTNWRSPCWVLMWALFFDPLTFILDCRKLTHIGLPYIVTHISLNHQVSECISHFAVRPSNVGAWHQWYHVLAIFVYILRS